jgi:hypothetical protein
MELELGESIVLPSVLDLCVFRDDEPEMVICRFAFGRVERWRDY